MNEFIIPDTMAGMWIDENGVKHSATEQGRKRRAEIEAAKRMAAGNQSTNNSRLSELENFSKRIDEQLQTFEKNVNMVTDNVRSIQKILSDDLGGEEAKEINDRFTRLIDQYESIKRIINTQYTNLSEKIIKYVKETRNNLQRTLEEIDRLDKEIQEVIDYFSTTQ